MGELPVRVYLVRVGGGFMRIDDFVNMYTPIEAEKINERKKERNKPGRKALMGKMLDNISKEYVVSEKCTHKEVNNEKAVKILQEAFTVQGGFTKCIVAPKKRVIQRSKTFKD